MRQAGRYQPSYRALRRRYSFMQMCKEPELSARVTLRAVSDLGVDAAILFSDILIPVEAMGMPVEFTEKRGPVLARPARTSRDIGRLRVPDPDEAMPFTAQAIGLIRKNLSDDVALIGFCGAPWTLASYMIEGAGSKNYILVKTMMFQRPDLFKALMDKITATVTRYLVAQVKAGAQVVQLFDSWAGALSPQDYSRFALPYSTRIIRDVKKQTGVPLIHFVHGGGGLLEIVKTAGSDVVGLDWRTDIVTARKRLGRGTAVQGNLDPCALFLPEKDIRRRTREILKANNSLRGHIFNLGHGILPPTKVAAAQAMVDEVHRFRLS
jgi:uroporphyrinogen decarboxylase